MSFYTQTPPPLFSNEPPPIDPAEDEDFDDFQAAPSNSFPHQPSLTVASKSSPHLSSDSKSNSEKNLCFSASPPVPHLEEVDDNNVQTLDVVNMDMVSTGPLFSHSTPTLPQPLPEKHSLFTEDDDLSSGAPSDAEQSDNDEHTQDQTNFWRSSQLSDVTDGTSSSTTNVFNPLQLGEYISHIVENCQASLNNDRGPSNLSTLSPTKAGGEPESGLKRECVSPVPEADLYSDGQRRNSFDEFGDFASTDHVESVPFADGEALVGRNHKLSSPSKPDAGMEVEDDFSDFADFSHMPIPDTKTSDPLGTSTNADDDDEFGEFEDFESKAPISDAGPADTETMKVPDEGFEDFANFQEASTKLPSDNKSTPSNSRTPSNILSGEQRITSATSISEHSGGGLLERLADKIEPLMVTCFPSKLTTQSNAAEENKKQFEHSLGEAEHRLKQNMDQRCKELLAYLEDFESSRSVKYQWNESHSYRDFLHLHGIDYESLIKSRQPALPAFACHMATTGGGILEPQKVVGLSAAAKTSAAQSVENGASSGRASPHVAGAGLTRCNGSGTSLDVAEFDWSASGLVNPLQTGLDTELLSAADTTGLSQCFQSGTDSPQTASLTMTKSVSSGNLKSAASNVLQRFLVKPPSASSSQSSMHRAQILTASNLHPQNGGKNLDELSETARDIVLRLPRIASYMNAKVLMFPLLSDRKSSVDSSMTN